MSDAGIKLIARTAHQLALSLFVGPGVLVRALVDDGINRVNDGDDARSERDGFANELVRIAGAVETFVMMQDHGTNFRREAVFAGEECADLTMRPHDRKFKVIEGSGLVQNVEGDVTLSQIVQEGGEAEIVKLWALEVEGVAEFHRHSADAAQV